jgi:alpha-L-fucosidase 2
MSPTRREFLGGSLALAALPARATLGFTKVEATHNTLSYATEAKRWLEAIPIGNGRIGGMVFGGIHQERIALTESTVWSVTRSASDINPGALQHLGQIRQLLFQEDYAQARQFCEQHLLSHPTSFGTNLPLLDLSLTVVHPVAVTQYRRSLDLDEGIARVEYRTGGQGFTRESFCSNPDGVLVLNLAGRLPGRLSLLKTRQ